MLRHMSHLDPDLTGMEIASCGIGDWHVGQLPDERITDAAKTRGISLLSRAKQFQKSYFDTYDYILAADTEVLNDLFHDAKTTEHKSKVHLITAFSPCYKDQEIPDPYYMGGAAFDLVLDMLEDACEGFLLHLKKGP